MTTIRTPDDEIDRPGYFYPPFTEGWWYEGATYGGHTDFSVDWNHRTKTGGVIQDLGDPVLAAARGTVADIERDTGTVFLNHWGGEFRTEYRHMSKVLVKVGDKVERGDKIGEIGMEGISPSSGFTPSPHLHHVHWRKIDGVWTRIKQTFHGKPIEASVWNSDSRPRSENLPGPTMIQGPGGRATWESAFRESEKARVKLDAALAAQKAQTELATDERDQARRELSTAKESATLLQQANQTIAEERDAARTDASLAKKAADELRTALTEAQAALTACQNATPPDCTGDVNADRNAVLDELTEWIASHRA